MNGLINFTNEQLNHIWTTFFFSPAIEPIIIDKPEGVTDNLWIYMVYMELKHRGIHPITESDHWFIQYLQKLDRIKTELKQMELGIE